MNQVLHREWEADIRSKMTARQTNEILQQQLQGLQPATNLRQDQNLELLKAGIKKSLGSSVMDNLSPQIEQGVVLDTPAAIILWVRQQVQGLGNALQAKAEAELVVTPWASSKTDLASWVGKLRSIASACGPNIPAGRPRENKIRDLIIKNVGEREPNTAQIIRDHRLHEVDEADYSVDDLVQALTKVMVKAETSGEKQCMTFAVEVASEADLQEKCAALLAENKKLENEKEQAVAEAKKNKEEVAFWAHSKGGGQPYGDDGDEAGWWPTGDFRVSKKFRQNCSKYYNSVGMGQEKYFAVRSHNASECHFQLE
jgi:hypothetical protein